MQGRNEAKISRLVKRLDFFLTVMLSEQNDGFPFLRFEAYVDPIALVVHLNKELLVLLDVCSAGRADLHKRELLPVERIFLQKIFDTSETLDNPFGIVEPVYPNAQECCFYVEFLQERGFIGGCREVFFRLTVGVGKGNTDWMGLHDREVATAIDGKSFPVDL